MKLPRQKRSDQGRDKRIRSETATTVLGERHGVSVAGPTPTKRIGIRAIPLA